MSSQFDKEYFQQFDIVMNALDNLPARRHVNRMCLGAEVPLIESGTEGYVGQVTVIAKGATECFECQPKPVPRSFPVCTIRSTPSAPIHCIVWAKAFLFSQLFGTPEDDSVDVDESSDNGSSSLLFPFSSPFPLLSSLSSALWFISFVHQAEEVLALKKEAEALKEIRNLIGKEEYPRMVFQKVFQKDIERLRGMKDMWRDKKPPTPLSYEELEKQKPSSEGQKITGLRDQQLWSLYQNFAVFLSSTAALGKRIQSETGPLSFDVSSLLPSIFSYFFFLFLFSFLFFKVNLF